MHCINHEQQVKFGFLVRKDNSVTENIEECFKAPDYGPLGHWLPITTIFRFFRMTAQKISSVETELSIFFE